MPLLDHFHPPLGERRHWEGFHARWASAIADDLNERGLPESLFAEPTVHVGGQMQIDVVTFEDSLRAFGNGAATTATLPQVVTVLAPTWVVPAVFPDTYSVHVMTTEGGPRLVAAIELISSSNKDRPESRRAFAVKCANFVAQSIPFIIIDIAPSAPSHFYLGVDRLQFYSGVLQLELPLDAALAVVDVFVPSGGFFTEFLD
ncbi:MAG: hypothetical protein EXS16_20245, partial [Gemmataceae bacterium]|nr:hypothetical protein [Gemmataceae bacterium]